jgi:formate dehydrogenase major subunit
VTGGAANDLSSIVLDPNVHIQEVKAFSVGIKPGRRPRGAALPEFVEQVRSRAHADREGAERVEPESVRKTT